MDTQGPSTPLTSSPFSGLATLRGGLASDHGDARPDAAEGPDAAVNAPSAPPRAKAADAAPSAPPRAVVRFQRKGRGGKEVTLVEHLDLAPDALEAWLKALKRSLGCGGVCEGDVLVLQGDQRERLPELLRQRGVRRVSCS